MKMKSYAQRLSEKKSDFVICFDPTFEVNEIESFAENGRVLKRSSVKVRDNREVMAQYNPDDFRIENLNAVGAMHDAKRYTLNPSTMEMMDAVNNGFEVLNDIVDMSSDLNNSNND